MDYVEREKIQKDILRNIESYNCLFRGGTALRLVYGLNRYSEDIDFTNGVSSEAERIYHECKIFAKKLSYNYTELHSLMDGAYFYIIKPKEYNGKIKIEISYEQTSDDLYYNTYGEIKVMSIEEILSEKIRAVIERKFPAPRDLFDMRFIYNNYHNKVFSLSPDFYRDLVSLKMRNTIYKVFDFNRFLENIERMKPYWTEIKKLIIGEDLPDFDETADFVIKNTKELLGI